MSTTQASRRPVSRREFLGQTLAGGAALCLSSFSLGATTEPGGGKPPNFVIIFCDDLGYGDLGCFGSTTIATPRLDRMAAEGMKFTDFYVAAPVCTPSRAALLTGCYPLRVSLPKVLNPASTIGISAEEITLAELLKSRGYATACIGKWHLGHLPPFLPTRHGFDYYFGIPYSNDMFKKQRGDPPIPLMRNEQIVEQPADQDTLTQRYTQEAIDFIAACKDKGQPFFVYLPHTMPHVPLHRSQPFRGKSKAGLYGDVVEEIDWSTGQILDAIKRLGLDEDTLVIFTSDNGPWLAYGKDHGSALPLRNGKGTTWEGGMREPCIMRWPGRIPAGAVCREMAVTMDLYPTLARLARAALPQDRIIDGKDIWPLMAATAGAATPHEAFFYYNAEKLEAVRCGQWKLILGATGELYDLQADIGESRNVAEANPELVKRLSALADRCRDDLGDALTGARGKNRRPPGQAKAPKNGPDIQ